MENQFKKAQERIDTQIKQSYLDALILIEFRSMKARRTITDKIDQTFFKDQLPKTKSLH